MASLGIGTSKLKPKVADIDPIINIKLLSEYSFYTRPNFEFVTENLNSLGESISIDFQGRDLTDFIQFKTNLVLPIDDISSQFTGISSLGTGDSISGISTFNLNYSSNSFLKKSFLDTTIESNPGEDLLFKKINHDFSSGELLTYEYDGTPIEIQSVSIPGIGTTTILPSNVYAIKSSTNFLKIASTESNALSGIGLTFISVGAGTTHYFSVTNANTRSLIIIDNLIQSPLYRKGVIVGLGTTSLGISTTTIPLSGISTISISDFLYIDDEIMKVKSISSGTTSVTVERGSMGSVSAAHTNGSSVHLYKGNFNIVKDKIYFVSPPLQNSTFTGRVFYKLKYDKNVIFDDLSRNFVGSARTFTLKSNYSNYGLSTSTVTGEQYGILSLNGIFQKPVIDYDTQSTTGITTLTFSGDSQYELPNSGKILSFDYTGGSNYQAQVAAGATVTVSSGGSITAITLKSTGGGYLSAPDVSVASTVGSGVSIVALVGTGASVGFVTGFTIVSAGTGYTTTENPVVTIDPPYGYTNLSLTYISGSNNGQDGKVSIVVGSGGSITSVDIDDIGYGYQSGDVLTVSGIGTLSGFTPFTFTVTNTYSDTFGFWSFGQLKRTTIPEVPDDSRTIFTINDITTGEPISFEPNTADSRFKITNSLLVLVNGIIQRPTTDYTIRNSFLRFSEAVPEGQSINVYVYTASDSDSVSRDISPTVKPGDILRIKGRGGEEVDQEPRGVYRIDGKNTVRTSSYDGLGINGSEDAFRKVDWTKQTRDSIVSNKKTYKTRELYDPLIKPKSALIVGVGTTSTELYVENIDLFDVDGIPESELQVEIVKDIPLDQSTASSVVSAAGTVSSISVTNGGSGYSQTNPPIVSISKRQITSEVKFESYTKLNTSSSIKYFNSHFADNKIVSVGSSLSYRYTSNLNTFTSSSIASSTTELRSVSYGSSIWMVVGSNGFISTSTNLSSWNSVGIATINQGSFPESISSYSFTNSINSLTYSSGDGRFVGVGSDGHIFTYETLDQSRIARYANNVVKRTSNTTQNLNKVIVNQVYDVGENQTKTQYVAVGNSSRVVLSATSVNGTLISNPPGLYWIEQNLSTLSGENLNGIVHTGISTIPFIIVGDNGLILTFPNNQFNDGSYYKVTPAPTSQNLKSVVYDSETETAIVVGTSGSIFTSTKLSEFKTWSVVSSGSTTNLNDIEYFETTDRYLIAGNTEFLLNNPQKVGAAATAVVSAAGTVSSITITNGGRFYGSSPDIIIDPPTLSLERFKSCKITGDYGRITGVTTTSGISTTTPALKFKLLVDSSLGISRSGISTGDYFGVYNSNVGSGVTSILSTGSTVGIGTTFIDCVFRADQVDNDGVSGIVTVTSNIKSTYGLTSIATTYYTYGDYSWGKIYDFDTRTNPISISAENLNGSAGLTTSPKVTRVTSVGTTVVPLEA